MENRHADADEQRERERDGDGDDAGESDRTTWGEEASCGRVEISGDRGVHDGDKARDGLR